MVVCGRPSEPITVRVTVRLETRRPPQLVDEEEDEEENENEEAVGGGGERGPLPGCWKGADVIIKNSK